jgi:NOL1/NOP2/fmu family ribosome biogenesis protein
VKESIRRLIEEARARPHQRIFKPPTMTPELRASRRMHGRRLGRLNRGKIRWEMITCFCLTCQKCKNRLKVRKWRARRIDITPLLSKSA